MSWISIHENTDFSIDNLPYGVFSRKNTNVYKIFKLFWCIFSKISCGLTSKLAVLIYPNTPKEKLVSFRLPRLSNSLINIKIISKDSRLLTY